MPLRKGSIGSNPIPSAKIMIRYAGVVELVDAPVLGTGIERCESSSLSFRTKINAE